MGVSLIISYDPVHEDVARQSVEAVFSEIGVKHEFLESEYGGVFLLDVDDPKTAVKELRNLCLENKDIFNWTFHYVPVDKWITSEVKDMRAAVSSVAAGIGENDKWKLDLTRRHYHQHDDHELIIKLTDVVDAGEVDLEKPEKIIKVEIIGKHAAVSLLEPDQLLVLGKI